MGLLFLSGAKMSKFHQSSTLAPEAEDNVNFDSVLLVHSYSKASIALHAHKPSKIGI